MATSQDEELDLFAAAATAAQQPVVYAELPLWALATLLKHHAKRGDTLEIGAAGIALTHSDGSRETEGPMSEGAARRIVLDWLESDHDLHGARLKDAYRALETVVERMVGEAARGGARALPAGMNAAGSSSQPYQTGNVGESEGKIDLDRFFDERGEILSAARHGELIDHAQAQRLSRDEAKNAIAQDPFHIRQLGAIDAMDQAIQAVRDRHAAEVNLHAWCKAGLVTAKGQEDFEEDLIDRVNTIRSEKKAEFWDLPDDRRHPAENVGKLIRAACKQIRDVELCGHKPQHRIVEGVLEELANDAEDMPVVWHPDGPERFGKRIDNGRGEL